jgi:uncharacterized pyridoxamine 5'-phosphate oxidase family protein
MMSSNKLGQEVIDIINRQATIVVVATVDEDGSPRTAPFGWVYAKDGRTLRLSMSRGHDTYKNIVRDGRVMACLVEEGDTAISIKGNARVCQEHLSVREHCAMVEVDITGIKSDVTSVASVISGIKCEINERYMEITKEIYKEMMK